MLRSSLRAVENRGGNRFFFTLASLVLVVAVLRIAEEVMIPLALALLLAFLLSPVVIRLMRFKLPRTVAISTTVVFALLVLTVVGWQVTNQAVGLLEDLPSYEENLHNKITALKKPSGGGSLSRALGTLDKIWTDIQTPEPKPSVSQPVRAEKPVPVEVKPANNSSFEIARDILKGLVKPLSTAGVVIVFVVAILFQREDLRSRFIRVIGGGHLNLATQAVDDAAQRVSRYLLAQLMINAGYGLCVGIGLYFIGVPHAPLWGLLSALLRFIPFLGPMIATFLPAILAVAVDPGWSMLFWTAGLFLVLELLTNNVVEVMLYGASTGISTLALLTAAVFWTWLWGMPGLFLSTPLTVCLLVIGQYVPGLKFLGVLLGSEPPLEPSAQFYQRMLSMDQEAMFATAQAYVQQRSLCDFYEDIFVPALLMAEVDRHNGDLAEVRQKFIFESSRELIEELGQTPIHPADVNPTEVKEAEPAPPPLRLVAGYPARDEADELVALMLQHLLRENGIRAEISPDASTITSEHGKLAPIAFISALPPSTLPAAGRLCRRLKEANPQMNVVIGVWSTTAKMDELKNRLSPSGATEIVTRLSDALVQLKNLAGLSAQQEQAAPAPQPAPEPVAEAKAAGEEPEDAIDAVIRKLAHAFNVPTSLVSLIESDRDYWKQWHASFTSSPWGEVSVHEEFFASDSNLVVEDISKDDRFAKTPTLLQRGVRFYAGVPLRHRDGRVVGNLGVLDTQPRKLNDEEHALLESLAAQLMDTLDNRPTPASVET